MENRPATNDTVVGNDQFLPDFRQTLAACTRQIDAFHLATQALQRMGAARSAVCIADPARDNRLVVRLSVGMEGATNKVLGYSRPGRVAALEAFARNETVVVGNYAVSEYAPTDLEEQLGIAAAAHLPIRAGDDHPALGLLLAVPPAAHPFGTNQLQAFAAIARELGLNLERLSAPKPAPVPVTGSDPGYPDGLFDSFTRCLNTADVEALSDEILEHCRRYTGSEFGFVGYVEPANGFLICPTMTRDIFARCQVAGKSVIFEKAGGLGGWVLDHRAPLIANDPPAHPASVGTPPGHLPIRKFMGVPCFSRGVLVGMIALANKDADYTGADLHLVSAFADIYGAGVARFLSERELTRSRNRYSSLYEEAPCGYQTLTPDGTIVEINETALQLMGRPREEVVGRMTLGDLLTTTGRALFLEQLRELKSGTRAAPVELHLKRPDGSRLPMLQSVTAVLDERGFLQAVRCTLVDISLRKMLRQTRDYLETMFNFSSSPIVVLDAALRITRFNPAFQRICGRGVEALIGTEFGTLLPEARRAALLPLFETCLTGARLEAAEIPVGDSSGALHTLLWNSSNLSSEDGTELVAVVLQGVDITGRKEAELALARTNRALKTLSRGNEALVHATTEEELVHNACDILVEVGGYRLAWIGYAEHDAAKSIRARWRGPDPTPTTCSRSG